MRRFQFAKSRLLVSSTTQTSLTLREMATERSIQRPLSPHVTIFKFPLPAIASITNRFTGVGLSVGVAAAGVATALAGPGIVPAFVDAIVSAGPVLTVPVKTIVAFPFVYHTLAGVRHLYWDQTANGLSLEGVRSSSLLVFALSGAGALALGLYSVSDKQ